MSPLERAQQVFLQARGLPPDQRDAFIDAQCQGAPETAALVRKLLMNDATGETASCGRTANAAPGRGRGALMPGARLNNFIIRDEIGYGSFGTVYRADQIIADGRNPARTVAIKVLHADKATGSIAERFEAERAVLAAMNHPCIATIFDGGLTPDSRPYFAMEYVEGCSITEHCRRRMLTVADRLALFARVCDGVQHAHSKGVVHRDLKPGNILVCADGAGGVGTPKIIDFGIAKLTHASPDEPGHTEDGEFVGTLAYTSPEQVGYLGYDIDAQADIYSLGVILYELLTGELPIDAHSGDEACSMFQMIRRICEKSPTPPSTRLADVVRRSAAGPRPAPTPEAPQVRPEELRGDIDCIILKCLEKDRTNRYSTAAALADDIRHHLADRPIVARPPTGTYLARKFVRRHRGTVALATAAILALVAGLVTTTLMMQRARAARADAVARAAELDAVVTFQRAQLYSLDPAVLGTRLLLGQIAQIRADAAKDPSAHDPESRVAAFQDLVHQFDFTALAAHAVDDQILRPVFAAVEQEFADQPRVQVDLLLAVAQAQHALGRYQSSAAGCETALAIARRHLGDDHPLTIRCLQSAGACRDRIGDLEGASALLREAVERANRTLGPLAPETLDANNNLVVHLKNIGRSKEARQLAVKVLEGRTSLYGPDNPLTLQSKVNLAVILYEGGSTDEAVAMLRSAVDRMRTMPRPGHRTTLPAEMTLLGWLDGRDRDREEARRLAEELVEQSRHAFGHLHPVTLEARSNAALKAIEREEFDEADRAYQELLSDVSAAFGPTHERTLGIRHNMAFLRLSRRRGAEALEILQPLADDCERVLGPSSPTTMTVRLGLADALLLTGRRDESLELLRSLAAQAERSLGQDASLTRHLVKTLATVESTTAPSDNAETSTAPTE